MDLNSWRDNLDLPFDGIRDAKLKIGVSEARYERFNLEARELIDAFNQFVRYRLSPVYLHRSSANASKPLAWRLSESKVFGFGKLARSYPLITPDVLVLLQEALKDDSELLSKIIEFDFKRLHLNYALAASFAESKRLEMYVEEFEIWRKLDGGASAE